MLTQFSIRGVEQDLSEALGPGATQLAFEGEGELNELVAPKRLLVQVLANLVRNAFDAQAEVGRTEPVRLVARIEAERARFEIFDSGPGIPAHARGRVGEPFFTTKAPGRGLGLGVVLGPRVRGEDGWRVDPGGATRRRHHSALDRAA